jgi:diguanylate cyclase (GGDEF)-like protein
MNDDRLPTRIGQGVPISDARSGHAAILITATAFLLLLAVAALDSLLIDTRFNVLLFYLVPIAWAAWFAGQNPAMLVAVFSAFMRFGVEFVEEVNHGLSRPELLWSVGTELVFFLVFTGLLVNVHTRLELERNLARSDALTRLYNGRAFEMAVASERERLMRYGRIMTLVYFDLDNFKFVNDKWGHAAGDEVLVTVAQTINRNIRQVDIGARLGGDEFAILLPETDYDGASIVLERVRRKLIEGMEAHGWPVTASFGSVTFEQAPAAVAEMMKASDAAMYHAKKSGKNQIYMIVHDGATS